MSATGRNRRGAERDPYDYYPTPAWCVRRLVDCCPWILAEKSVLDPCAGDGAILRALPEVSKEKKHAIEIQGRFLKQLSEEARHVVIADALVQLRDPIIRGRRYGLGLTNPPFGIAYALLRALVEVADEVILLLRLSFLASVERHAWMRAHPPSIYVLPNRPIFVRGQSDNCDYAWMRWSRAVVTPTVTILDATPERERAA